MIQKTIRDFIADLAHPDRASRRLAAKALGEIGRTATEAVPALVRCLADEDEAVRVAAVEALGRIDPQDSQTPSAKEAVKALTKRLTQE